MTAGVLGSGRGVPVAAFTLVLAILVSGCAGNPFDQGPKTPSRLFAYGDMDSGFVSVGYAYDGVGTRPMRVGIGINVTDDLNDGQVTIGGYTYDDHPLFVLMSEFEGTKPFQDGGVEREFREHGDSGVGDASIPAVDLRMAAWGNASLVMDTYPYVNPVTMKPTWLGHLMVIENGVHEPVSHAIRKADGQNVYDPTTPADAYTDPEDKEVMFVLKSHDGVHEGSVGMPFSMSAGDNAPLADPNLAFSDEFFNTAWGATAVVDVELSTQAPSLSATNLNFTVRSPSGREVAWADLGGGSGTHDNATLRFAADEYGLYSVRATGQAVAATFQVTGTYEARDPILIVFTWEDVSFGADAKQAIKEWRQLLEFVAIGGNPPPEPGDPIPGAVDSSRPPGINLIIVGMGVLAGFLCVLLIIKFVMESAKGRRFQERFGKK